MSIKTNPQTDTTFHTDNLNLHSNNFFELFGLPIAFDIDLHQLDEQYRVLQRQFHPDLQGKDADLKAAQTNSALVNHAYHTLKAGDKRANYLLQLNDKLDDTATSISDLNFLDDAMQLRVDLDDALTAKNKQVLQSLFEQVKQRIDNHENVFVAAYASKDWANANDAAQKLAFLYKLQNDVKSAVDEATNMDEEDDDDLYV